MPQWEWINISKIKLKNKIMADFTTQTIPMNLMITFNTDNTHESDDNVQHRQYP